MLILFEGLDFAGKETLARALVMHLNEQNTPAEYSSRTLTKGWFYYVVDRIYHSEVVPRFIRSTVYFLIPIVDRLLFRQPREWVIHESYIWRSVAYYEAQGKHLFPFFTRLMAPAFHQFDLTIYLVASFDERVRRYHKSGIKNFRDDARFADREAFISIETRLDAIMQTQQNCVRIDTTGVSVDTSFQQVLLAVETFLLKKQNCCINDDVATPS